MGALRSSHPVFQPSADQVEAANALLDAITLEETLRPIVTGYQRDILARHQFMIAERWINAGEDPRLILDPRLDYLLEDSDAAIYLQECRDARDARNLKVKAFDNCPLLEASSRRIQCENALMLAMSSIPTLEGLGRGQHLSGEKRHKAVELSLRLLAPFCRASSSKDMVSAVLACSEAQATAEKAQSKEPSSDLDMEP